MKRPLNTHLFQRPARWGVLPLLALALTACGGGSKESAIFQPGEVVTFAATLPEPRALGIDFAFTAAFIAILRGLWGGARDVVPWLASAGTVAALALLTPMEPSWALVIGGALGAVLAGIGGRDA